MSALCILFKVYPGYEQGKARSILSVIEHFSIVLQKLKLTDRVAITKNLGHSTKLHFRKSQCPFHINVLEG
ncbi:MAG TPA: hypothetical protein VNW54_06410 [Granulicella sp.]|nr:hypothetical protein [Granulicella sp.]